MKRCLLFCVSFTLAGSFSGKSETIENSVGMKLVRIEPGSFIMGQDGPKTDYAMNKHPGEFETSDWDESPAHRVTITQPFHMTTTEVTLRQFRHFDPDFRRSEVKLDDAVNAIAWNHAVEYCEWLSQREGKTYRLPTEAEWEYACRAGSTTVFNTGDTLPDGSLNWFSERGRREFYFPDGKMPAMYRWTKEPVSLHVAQRAPNAWGLYDMHGNLAEWCRDWYGPYEAGESSDPLGRADGDFRVFRDGSHSNFARMVRSANRGGWIPSSISDGIGFRVVMGELPKGILLPTAKPALHARDVVLARTAPASSSIEEPYFMGPIEFVKIPKNSCGPLFSRHNHSPSIVECPNGDLLATWFSCVEEPGPELNNLGSRLRVGSTAWEPASVFWDGADVNDHAPKLWRVSDDAILHIARGLAENILRTSLDSGATWSKAQTMQPFGELGNLPFRMKDGTIVITHDSRFASLMISRDNGATWNVVPGNWGKSDFRPGGSGSRHAGIHAPIVELADGRLMTIGRFDADELQAKFDARTPVSYSADLGKTWTYVASEFPAISSAQRAVLFRLREGPLLLCSFTDQGRNWKTRKGLAFTAVDGKQFVGYGLFAALSFDDGKTWPARRLITPGGKPRELPAIDHTTSTFSDTMSERTGYLTITQAADGRLHILSSKNHYSFNLAWLQQPPPMP